MENLYPNLSKHLLQLAGETLHTIQSDPDLTRLCERGQDHSLPLEELRKLQDEAAQRSVFGDYANLTPKHDAAAVISHAINVLVDGLKGDYKEAWLNLRTFPNTYALAQCAESGMPYDANDPEGRELQETIQNSLIARCPDFAPLFAR